MFKKIAPLIILLASASIAIAQDATSQSATAQQSPDPQQLQEEKAKLEKKGVALLEQVVTEAQVLKLPENRIRVQIAAGDMLWDKNAARARGLLTDAGAMLGQVMMEVDRSDRDDMMTVNQLRQDLVLTAGRHDAELGYQLLHSTQPQPQNQTAALGPGRGNRNFIFDQGNNLEQTLLATVASTDPKFAYQKAVESLDKGDFPISLSRILTQLQTKDAELFKKLSDKTLNRLASDSLLASREATSVAVNLLLPGPMPGSTASTQTTSATASANVRAPILSESAYHDLMDSAITAALSVTSMGPTNSMQRGGGAARVMRGAQPPQPQSPPDDATVRQNNARSILFSLQGMLPQIDQYMPDRAQAVRQKLTELGVNNNSLQSFGNQMRSAMQQGSSDSLVTAASTAPPQIQSRLYQQAAQKAVDEGNTDKALDIATNHLDEAGRTAIMQAVDFKKLTTTASPEKLNEIKQKLAALPSDSDRVKYLVDLATGTQKDNQKLALRFLDDARNLVAKRAMDYKDFEDQIKVADAYASLDSRKSFEIMDAGIAQLNELLQAATVLNGFEVDIFKEGELSLRANNDLVGMISRYGAELSALAKVDFDAARGSADKFQLPEPRMNARLMIVQSVLGTQPVGNFNNRRGNNFQFLMR
ncbi:MAG: hypothetical protein ABR607_15035 [Pyrinomonadaceae bacterium]